MATYEYSQCGMVVNASCAKCNESLIHDVLTKNDGTEVQISKCPNAH